MANKHVKEPKFSVNVSLSQKCLQDMDANIEKLKNILISKGADPVRVNKEMSRSSLLRELVQSLADPRGFAILQSVMLLAFDVDGSQMELDLK